MGENKGNTFDFWNDHSLEFLEMAMRRDYQERVSDCHATGKASRECGDTIVFFLMVDDGHLTAISYDVQGCIFTHACANTIIELARGKSVDRAAQIGKADILSFLKTLPEKEHHCADLSLKAFNRALSDIAS